jgi:hypothetical protein
MNVEEAKALTPFQVEFLKQLREIKEAIKSLKED